MKSLVGAAAAACLLSIAAPGAGARFTATEAFGDQCMDAPGYREFRAKLAGAVAARDGDAFRALFHPAGAMRLSGIGGRANTPDWGFGRPEAREVWDELDHVLALGCARRGEKLVLPAMANLTGGMEPEQLIVLRAVKVRTAPNGKGRVLRSAAPGDVVTFTVYDTPAGWTRLRFGRRTGYAATSALRSPFAIQLVLVPFEGGWRIRELGDNV